MTSTQRNIRNQFVCDKHFEESDFEEITSNEDESKEEGPKQVLKKGKLRVK